MTKEDFQNTMLDLATCQISPEAWAAWWKAHSEEARGLLSEGEYLRIKPVSHPFRWVPILGSQKGAVGYLEKNGIAFELSDIYQKNWVREFEAFGKEIKEKQKTVLAELKERFPRLFARYPRFSNSLKNAFSEGDQLETGVSEDALRSAPCVLPNDIAEFFRTVSTIHLDGIALAFSDLRTEILCGKEYLVLGEFWKEADGDLLLIKPDNASLPTPIYYYSHGINKVKKLCSGMDDLMEKKFSYYNNQ